MIVAVSGGGNAAKAAMYAIMLSKTYGFSIKFVYVVDTATIKYLSMNKLLISEERDGFEQKLREHGENYLKYVQLLASKKGVKAETEIRAGGIFSEIIKAAEEYEADQIILGGIEKNILSHAKCPVLIVQDSAIENQFKNF